MKTKNALITLVILLVIGALAVVAIRKNERQAVIETMPADQTAVLAGEQCFYQETPTASGFNDVWSLRLNIADGRVIGDMAIVPAEKDSSRGTLNGAVTENEGGYVVDAQFNYMIEGTTGVDQRIFRVDSNGAYFGYGELYEAADGSYQYKNPESLTYVGPVPQVDCAIMPAM